MSASEYRAFLGGPYLGERIAELADTPLVVVDGDDPSLANPGAAPVVVCALGSALGGSGPDGADLIVPESAVDTLAERVAAAPRAAVTLAVLLRSSEYLPVEHGLAAESAAYSMLQGSGGFARWRGDVAPMLAAEETPAVQVDRSGTTLHITLDRPHRHNAITRQLRDELCAALDVACLDDSINEVRLAGNGPSFCSGGDLAEFGSRSDPAAAHLTRLAQSPARLIHRLRGHSTVAVHGATLGGGIEMAAFAGRVVAHPATRIGLPEVGLGLIPGAGGTVSLPRRIGRQRTAAIALATDTIDATTAHRWGLVDAIAD
ncbi:MAG TPA: enoyl-CoA hydratase/isomerase family protein [Ilumatobacter sp.]|nr:enoyl-CoA hydratase/isomerase family protein [Ilumatobacter sp.]